MAHDIVRAWRPGVPGVAEVLHAAWREHSYPAHTHDTWTVLIVDDGLIGYGLDGREHAAQDVGVTVLPPGVVHDGRSVSAAGFRKRVVYLEEGALDGRLVGHAVDAPLVVDDSLRARFAGLDRALTLREDVAAESLLALVTEGLAWHLSGRPAPPREPPPASTARNARDLLDADPTRPIRLAEIADRIGVTVPHLVRAFTREFGLPPHRYLVGRRLDLARRRLLAGEPAADVAAATGFHDQAHLARHFRRLLRTTPGRYQRGGGAT
ncbi:AraC family transcriptional regulator [Myceligenerans pegani]|uniref:Helix-turn-helix transcriptional regulator n=1 Tax=Myceligenerans pegani TaxID=2776917 RepID=A0ABR9N6H0_9MICO|nr:AraC family transcriptional regulator [Myceligenerans sp. TRM 65318]MBE1878723.1 helix-turn-helix transcriptional regulator [Myceligenerans sp. TRM 65318]MBE3020994.1 helix-turn-helix transcriptional regulator [Myceligenerans sp. TRM 65318]